MYRHDPSVMLYAPLRTAIYVGAADRTRFAGDKPSTVFASFASPADLPGRHRTRPQARRPARRA
jgi:hypothetical protein